MIHHNTKHSFRQTLQLLLGIALGLCIYALLTQITGYFTLNNFKPWLGEQLWILLVKVWLPWVFIFPVIVLLALHAPLAPERWTKALVLHLIVFLLLCLLHSALLSYHYFHSADILASMHSYQAWQHMGHYLFGDSLMLYDLIIYTLIIANINLRYFYSIAQTKDIEASQLEHQLTAAKLQALRMQINPHFLFNTLNVISVLILKGENQKAAIMIGRLSHLFRQSLDENDQAIVMLEKELDTIEQYLEIEKVRFGERLSYNILCPAELLSLQIPAMLLQPLIENAMHHGLGKRELPGAVSILCEKSDAGLDIVIKDNGAGFDMGQKHKPGIGIRNVQQRLHNYYGEQFSFRIESAPDQGTTVSITLPLTHAR